jgi:predicted methyltransferase
MNRAAQILIATTLALGPSAIFAQSQGMQSGMQHGMQHGGGMMRGPAGMLTKQDAGSAADMGLVMDLVHNNTKIKRTVTNLPDGIKTVTESDDPQVAQAIKTHVASMSGRLKDGREFNIFSTTLPVIFDNADKIKSVVEMTDKGAVVIQTTADAKVAVALQAHATEVTELVQEGPAAFHRGLNARMAMGPDGPRGAMQRTAQAAKPAITASQSPHTHDHSFSGAEQWAKIFDDPKRDAWQKPHEVIQALKLKPDAVVADIGSGTGYFSVRFAHMVPKGKVYGLDTEPDMVKYLADRAKRAGLNNVTAVQVKPGNPQLPEAADLVVLVDVYHHVEYREQYFRQLQKSLKTGGRLAVIDFRLDSPEGPPKAARIAPEQVKAELQRAGYNLSEEHGFLPNQYFLIFSPAK